MSQITTRSTGGGSAITFIDWTPWTPTVAGGTVPGVTTYSIQQGWYSRIGNVAIVSFNVGYTGATGSGNITISGLPVVINGSVNAVAIGSAVISSAATPWPAGGTSLSLIGVVGTTTMTIFVNGSLSGGSNIQMANVSAVLQGTLVYRI